MSTQRLGCVKRVHRVSYGEGRCYLLSTSEFSQTDVVLYGRVQEVSRRDLQYLESALHSQVALVGRLGSRKVYSGEFQEDRALGRVACLRDSRGDSLTGQQGNVNARLTKTQTRKESVANCGPFVSPARPTNQATL